MVNERKYTKNTKYISARNFHSFSFRLLIKPMVLMKSFCYNKANFSYFFPESQFLAKNKKRAPQPEKRSFIQKLNLTFSPFRRSHVLVDQNPISALFFTKLKLKLTFLHNIKLFYKEITLISF